MTRGHHHLIIAALVTVAGLVLLAQGASAQTQCSATKACPDTTNCCSQFGYCGKGSAYCGTGCQNGPCTGGTASAPPAGGSGWSSFLTKAVFEGFFPNRVPFYTYESFQTATGAFSTFGTSGTLDDQKRELAAFLGNVKQESGGLQFTVEQSPPIIYCKPSTQYPCAAGKTYIGRGPMQLSWNYNYGACGAALKIADLLANPDQVAHNSNTAWRTALWFWMTTNCHNAILQNSFSGTIRAINGEIECSPKAGSGGHNEMLNRVKYYKSLCQTLGVDPGTDLEC